MWAEERVRELEKQAEALWKMYDEVLEKYKEKTELVVQLNQQIKEQTELVTQLTKQIEDDPFSDMTW